jgi:hypothetical protein
MTAGLFILGQRLETGHPAAGTPGWRQELMEQILRQALAPENRLAVQVFLYLQLLDLLTTLVGLRMGATEASPFIRALMEFGPAVGVLLSKLIAITLGVLCVWLDKAHLIRKICYWYAALVVWNLSVLLSLQAG